jgi:hypothetical protein
MLMDEDITSRSRDAAADRPPILSSIEIDNLLSARLIPNLATVNQDGGVHLLLIWFLRVGNEIDLPTSSYTHKYRNVRERPRAFVMIGVSRGGLDLKGVLIRGRVELVYGEDARQINRLIHLKYVTPEVLSEANVAVYFSKGDDVTVKIHLDHLISWNLASSKVGKALSLRQIPST